MTTEKADQSDRRLRTLFAAAVVLGIALLAFFAYSLADAQQQQREDLEKRFGDRADVSAAVTEAIFNSASAQNRAENAVRFGGATVNPAVLIRQSRQSQSPYSEILDSKGKVLAATPGAPRTSGAERPHVQKALRTNRIELSDVLEGPRNVLVTESAFAFPTRYGKRVQVSAIRSPLLAQFLGGFLSQVPNVAEAKSYVVDSKAIVIGGTERARPGMPLPDRELANALRGDRQGPYGDGRYFASAPVGGSPWRVVLTTTEDELYESVNGSQRTIPWLIFAAFALVGGLGLLLFRRVLVSNARLQRAELNRMHALEINDNVVQRLVVAKLALERGATETSREKLAETLQETQQLVTSLLEEKEIAPGVLRRGKPAETAEPPDPDKPGGRK